MDDKDLVNVQALSFLVGSSIQTISSWYRWKSLNPDHELSTLLPDFIRKGNKNTRYWKRSDVWKIIEFKNSIPQGRKGIMGAVTQRYCRDNFRNKNKVEKEQKTENE